MTPDEKHLRRLLATTAAIPHMYFDDGELQASEHGISIDFMRDSVAEIDAKLRALGIERLRLQQSQQLEMWGNPVEKVK